MEKPITHKNYLFRFHIFHTKLTVKKSLDKHIQRKIWNVTLFLFAMFFFFLFFWYLCSTRIYQIRLFSVFFFHYPHKRWHLSTPIHLFPIWNIDEIQYSEKKYAFFELFIFMCDLNSICFYRNCMHDGKITR